MPFLAPSPLLEPDFTRYPHYSSKSPFFIPSLGRNVSSK
jgi:hypothetical protein